MKILSLNSRSQKVNLRSELHSLSLSGTFDGAFVVVEYFNEDDEAWVVDNDISDITEATAFEVFERKSTKYRLRINQASENTAVSYDFNIVTDDSGLTYATARRGGSGGASSEIPYPLALTLIGDSSNDVKAYALDAIPDNWKTGDSTATTLHIGSSVTTIGSYAFNYCSGLTGDLTIGNSVTSIGSYAFNYCSGLTGDLTIPDSVTTIDSKAFYICSGFTGDLTIGNSVTSIGVSAFYGCAGLTGGLTIGNSVTSIGSYAFGYCTGFTGDLTIPDSVTTIGDRAFNYCTGLTGDLTIGNSVTSFGSSAFSDCTGLTGDLTIPDSVTSFGSYAFAECYGFTGDLIIPDSVTSIGSYAFHYCSGFSALTLGNSVTSIGSSAFAYCDGFSSINILANPAPTVDVNSFTGCSPTDSSIHVPVGATGYAASYSGLTVVYDL